MTFGNEGLKVKSFKFDPEVVISITLILELRSCIPIVFLTFYRPRLQSNQSQSHCLNKMHVVNQGRIQKFLTEGSVFLMTGGGELVLHNGVHQCHTPSCLYFFHPPPDRKCQMSTFVARFKTLHLCNLSTYFPTCLKTLQLYVNGNT